MYIYIYRQIDRQIDIDRYKYVYFTFESLSKIHEKCGKMAVNP